MMRPVVEPEYLLKLDTHKYTILLLCLFRARRNINLITYLMYVNDIRNATTLNVLSFADDTTIITSSPDIKELYAKMNFE